MEERTARVEARTDHIQHDLAELKADVRRVDAKVDAVKDGIGALRVDVKDAVDELRADTAESLRSISARFAKLDARFEKLQTSRALDKLWWMGIAAALLSVMARGLKWI